MSAFAGSPYSQINAYDATHGTEGGSKAVEDYKKTSLREHLDFFHRAFLDPLYRGIRSQMRDEKDQLAAASGDF